MKKLFAILLLAALLPHRAPTQQPTLPPDIQAKKEIGAASAAVGHAIETKDTAALEKLWSPQMLVNSPANRVLNREEVFQAIREASSNTPASKPKSNPFRSSATSAS